ncbi:unnamed protein product, partial [Brassica rapa]
FGIYFSILDHRAALLRPLAETKTLAGHCKTKNQICGHHFKLISKILNPSQLKLESYGEEEA